MASAVAATSQAMSLGSAGEPGVPLRRLPWARVPVPRRPLRFLPLLQLSGLDVESCSESEASLTAGDLEVVASAAPGPVSPCRTCSKGKARSPKPLEDRDSQVAGEHHSAPAPVQGMSPPAMALSPEGPDTHLLHSHREVWEDKLSWEEIRAMKCSSRVVESSQEPSSTPVLCESTPSPSASAEAVSVVAPYRDLGALRTSGTWLPVRQWSLNWPLTSSAGVTSWVTVRRMFLSLCHSVGRYWL